jgi:poly-gamma-glutamate system protein
MKEKLTAAVLACCALAGVAAILLAKRFSASAPLPCYGEMISAASLMEECSRAVREKRESLGYAVDRGVDLNGAGLIGDEFTSITTTAGNLEAKRTTSSPEFAALFVRLYREAGVKSGDTIAVGASGSFPGAFIASLCAAKVMKVNAVAAISLGASNWGANIPELTILDMYNEIAEFAPAAALLVSLGGREDSGGDFGLGFVPGDRAAMVQKMRDSGFPFVLEADFEKAVKRRLDFYAEYSGGLENYAAFVNTGGADVNIGTGPWSLELKPGINKAAAASRGLGEGGCITAFLNKGVPVIHILNIKTLALDYGLAFDPSPPPTAGAGELYYEKNSRRQIIVYLIASAAYLIVCAAAVVILRFQ